VTEKKRQEIHWSMLNAHCARRKAILYFTEFTPALAATVQSLVTDVWYTALMRFPIIAQHSKGVHFFHRVVGLVVRGITLTHCQNLTWFQHSVVNICQCKESHSPIVKTWRDFSIQWLIYVSARNHTHPLSKRDVISAFSG